MSSCLFSPFAVPIGKNKQKRRATALIGDSKSSLLASQLTEFFMSSNRDSNKISRKLSRKSSKAESISQPVDSRVLRLTPNNPAQELKTLKQFQKKFREKEKELEKLQSSLASTEMENVETMKQVECFEEQFGQLFNMLQSNQQMHEVAALAENIYKSLNGTEK